MPEYLNEGMSYSADGDLVDNRDMMIRSLKSDRFCADREEDEERMLREKHPQLQEMWDQYQVMKKLLT